MGCWWAGSRWVYSGRIGLSCGHWADWLRAGSGPSGTERDGSEKGSSEAEASVVAASGIHLTRKLKSS